MNAPLYTTRNSLGKTLTQFAILALISSFLMMASAHAGTTGLEFKDTYDLVVGWATGYLGKIFAISAFLIGCGFSAARQNPMPAVFGLVLALIIGFGPALIEKLLTATI